MNGDPLSVAQAVFATPGDLAFAAWLSREQAFARVSPAYRGWTRATRCTAIAVSVSCCAISARCGCNLRR